jgi:hypothetical protein
MCRELEGGVVVCGGEGVIQTVNAIAVCDRRFPAIKVMPGQLAGARKQLFKEELRASCLRCHE